MPNEPRTIRRLAYSAVTQANNNREAALASLNQLVIGQFTAAAGKVMTQASATNKSFAFTLEAGFGPNQIADLAFDAIGLINAITDEQFPDLARTPSQWGIVRF